MFETAKQLYEFFGSIWWYVATPTYTDTVLCGLDSKDFQMIPNSRLIDILNIQIS